ADDLADAKKLEAALDFEGALAIVDRVIAGGGADRDKLVELHVFAARLAAGLDREPVAEDHFARALALSPSMTLPEGTSPKIVRPFETARAHTVPLRVTGSVDRGVATVVADSDALALVAGIAVDVVEHGERRVLREAQGRRVEIPDGAEVHTI